MRELLVEFAVLVVDHLDHAVLNAKRIGIINTQRVFRHLNGPAVKISAVEKRNPTRIGRIRSGGRRGDRRDHGGSKREGEESYL